MAEENFGELSVQIAKLASRIEDLYGNLYGGDGRVGDITRIMGLIDKHEAKLAENTNTLSIHSERWSTIRWFIWGGLGGGITGLGAFVRSFLGS